MPRVAFLHPDLGIGGAERLVVDAALALKRSGHSVTLFTSHHSTDHCFPETRNGELNVIVAGDWLPRSTFGKLKAFWAYIRMLYLSIYFVLSHGQDFDTTISDIIPVGLMILKAMNHRCIFYCHFPDQLLTKKETLLKKLYRAPIDWIEEFTIGFADVVFVNSGFTKSVFEKTFKRLKNVQTKILYPSLDFSAFDIKKSSKESEDNNETFEEMKQFCSRNTVFLSINRYERKKNIALAIEALKIILKKSDRVHLYICGGYDPRNRENIEHYEELVSLAERLNIRDHITFYRSPSDEVKKMLITCSTAIVYTPENEHFGIVPLEAMYLRKPVIATNTGGPKETVVHGETGFLCETNAEAFAVAMMKFVENNSLSVKMGDRGHENVVSRFNFATFQSQLDSVVRGLKKNN